MKAYIKDLGRVSLVPKGEFNSSNEYERLDLVYDKTTRLAYVAKDNIAKGSTLTDTTVWQPMSIAIDYIEKWIAITDKEIDNIVN